MAKIYTRTGDQGTTSLFTGHRVSKNETVIEALGSVDEANSSIGVALSFLPKEELFNPIKVQLETIQHALFDIGAALATPLTKGTPQKLEKTRFGQQAILLLEGWIDEMENKIPKLTYFILPGGHPAGALLHLSRSIIRRAERTAVPLFEREDTPSEVLIYLNRLSDYLFVSSRFINHLLQLPETRWQPHSMS